MTRPRSAHPLLPLWGAAVVLAIAPPAPAQNPAPPSLSRIAAAEPARPELIVLQALQANPVTAPYGIATAYREGRVVLRGVVGTKRIHDVAVQLAIASGYSVRDDLTIDTGAVHRVAAWASTGTTPALGAGPGSLPYVYPPPLFGRLDDPFFGFEPPLVSYSPWFPATAARNAVNLAATSNPGAGVALAAPSPTSAGVSRTAPGPVAAPPGADSIEMTINERGFAVLRGTVPTLEARIAIGQKIAQTPGVVQVLNLLNVAPAFSSESPPPPPQPAFRPPQKPPAPQPADLEPAANRRAIAIEGDGGGLGQRISQALGNRPALAGLPIKVAVQDGSASLSGTVPTVYEAMLAFRAVQQTPGVREVIDRLEFVVPDGERKNPLIEKGRPEDVEPYLLAQVRRDVGDLAHVDQLRARGDLLEVRGALVHAEDRPRLDAILRSIPVLRGYRIEPSFTTE